MANFRITVDGALATEVTGVEYGSEEGGNVSVAKITVLNNQSTRDLFKTGKPVTIEREDASNPGSFEIDFEGEVVSKPSNASAQNLTLTVEAESLSGRLANAKVSRPFINTDSGVAVRKAATEEIEPKTEPAYISAGEDASEWESNANVFEAGGITKRKVNKFGGDVLYGDFREGESKSWYFRRDGIPKSTVPNSRILRLESRLFVNNRGGVFDAQLELVDSGGLSYVWDLDLPESASSKTFELPPTDASIGSGSLSGKNKAELRLSSDGPIPEHRAVAIDMLRTIPFSVKPREGALETEVEETGRSITRRLDGSVLEVANKIATEDGAVVYVDDNSTLHFESAGDTDATVSIDDTTATGVVDVEVDREFDVTNRVVVQGKDNLRATFEDKASIRFYNSQSPREKPIVDKSLRTKEDLEARGRGFLNDNAWEDTAMKFTLANSEFRKVSVGQLIDVSWPPESIDGTFVVSSTDTTDDGFVTLQMTGSTEA